MSDDRVRTARHGRGATHDPPNRYASERREAIDDGWGSLDEPLAPLPTTVTLDHSRTIIATNDSPDIPFDQSINPYRGCEHGCVYCYARPSHAQLGYSPGQEFESRLVAKPKAAALLEAALRRPGYQCRLIALGTNTDPYQPIERRYRITRALLEVLSAFRHPLSIVTKSALVQRDIDILAPMAASNLAMVFVSITTLDRRLARAMEPRAATPERRLETVRALAGAGIPTGVMVAPLIPALNEAEIEAILERAAEAGAASAGYVLLRLPLEIKELFEGWLDIHRPDAKSRILNRVRELRGGRLYDPRFGQRMQGQGPGAELIRQRFNLACRRFGLNQRRQALDTARFRVPAAAGDQLALL